MRQLIGHYVTITSGVLARLAISLVYFLIVANRLSLDDFGRFAAVSAIGLVLSRVFGFGFVSPVYRIATTKPRLLGVYAGGLLLASLASIPFVAVLAVIIHGLAFGEALPLWIFSLIIVSEVIGWRVVEYVAIINNGLSRFGRGSMLVIISSGLRAGAALIFAASGGTALSSWVWLYLAATLLSAVTGIVFFLPRLTLRFHPSLMLRRWKDAVGTAGAEILFYVQSELDKLLVLMLAGPASAGLYAIVMRVVDLTAIPVRSFNQLLVQRIMKAGKGLTTRQRWLIECAIALISTGGIAFVVVLLWWKPDLLGRNIATASGLFLLVLAVPAFRNLIEYHAELLYAAERVGLRLVLLGTQALLKASLMVAAILMLVDDQRWFFALNAIFALLFLVSLWMSLRFLKQRLPAG
jgi:O-antigen/teichoic acid export membrane protein